MLERILHPRRYQMIDYGIVIYGDGETQSRRFAVSAGIGWDAAICHNLLDSRAKRFLNRIRLGSLAYVVIGLKQWALARPADGKLILDGCREVPLKKLFFVSAHNLKYEGGGFMFGPGAEPSDGMLELCVMSRMGKLAAVPAVLAAKTGRHGIFPGVDFYRCRKAEICLKKPAAVHADGESCGRQSRVLFTCRQKKIRFIV